MIGNNAIEWEKPSDSKRAKDTEKTFEDKRTIVDKNPKIKEWTTKQKETF